MNTTRTRLVIWEDLGDGGLLNVDKGVQLVISRSSLSLPVLVLSHSILSSDELLDVCIPGSLILDDHAVSNISDLSTLSNVDLSTLSCLEASWPADGGSVSR